MERRLMTQLLAWKDSKNRKPLLLEGARQVGKTWLLNEFGKRYFKKIANVDFLAFHVFVRKMCKSQGLFVSIMCN